MQRRPVAFGQRISEAVRPRQRRERNAYAVWELTLKCNLAYEEHCGSRAGKARDDELSTEEALDLVRQVAEKGIDEVTIEGGEAFLRKDWFTIARAITDAGMSCSMITGGIRGVARAFAAHERGRHRRRFRVGRRAPGYARRHSRSSGLLLVLLRGARPFPRGRPRDLHQHADQSALGVRAARPLRAPNQLGQTLDASSSRRTRCANTSSSSRATKWRVPSCSAKTTAPTILVRPSRFAGKGKSR